MNLVGKAQTELLSASFNQDSSCLSVGTTQGYKLYNCDPFGRCFTKAVGSIQIAEMLFCSALVALVGAGVQPALSPRSLQIANTKRDTKVCELNFKTSILAVRMNRKRLVVVLEDRMHIYDITIMKHLHPVETPPNPKGLMALSPNADNNYLAYQPSSVSGDVLVFDCLNLQAVTIIAAHKTPLSQLAFDDTGTLLATASSKGTVIRVYSVPGGQLLHQYRRGSYPAQIHSLAFSRDSKLLAVSSDTDTVHIFKLDQRPPPPKTMAGGALAGLSAWLPQVVSDVWEPERDHAFLKLPGGGGQPTLVAFSNNSPPLVMAVTGDGSFYQFSVASDGGECVLLNRHSLLDSADSASDTQDEDRPPSIVQSG